MPELKSAETEELKVEVTVETKESALEGGDG